VSPRLDGFLNSHPDACIKLVTSIWKNPSDQHPVDVDVILAPKDHARSDLELLSDETIVPIFGSTSEYEFECPDDLLDHPPIHIMGFDDHWARYLSAHNLKPTSPCGRLTTDTSTAAIEMVAAGLGCAVVIERFAKQAVTTGQRIQIVGNPVTLGQSHYLIRTERSTKAQPHLEEFETWLRQQF